MGSFRAVSLICLIAAMSVGYLGIGLRGIISRKPSLFHSRWLLAYAVGLLLAMFVPGMLQPWLHPFPDVGEVSRSFTILACFSLAALVCFAVFMWIVLRGYFAFAVTDSSFRDALFASLNKLELPYEESLGAVHLPSLGAHLQVSVQAWAATAQIKMKEWRFRGVLSDIVRGMKEHYRASASPVNPTCCIPYVMIGILGTVFSVWFYFLEFA